LSPGFSSEFKELVRSQTDLVALVGETIALKPVRGGRDFVGLCPFHDDHNPSFTVNPERQSYRCWVCNEGGDCFSFVMKTDGIGFREALEMLAERARIEIPKNLRRGPADGPGTKADLHKIIAWAEAELHQCLLKSSQGERARAYLADRGFQDETIRQFRIGYHPDDWEWLIAKARGKFTPEQLVAARLVRERDGRSGYFDERLFIDRVVFPIRDMRGRPVAFGGRVLPDCKQENPPKYINSAEGPLFAKSSLLYGFDAARDAIRRSETVVIVEGYTDCIIAHQFGVRNVVGTLGTALTDMHVTNLKRLARRVVQCFDGDDAGRKAAERSLVKFIAQDVDLRILTLPGGQDPAEFLAERGADEFQRLVESSTELWEHKLRLTFDRFGFDGAKASEDVLKEMTSVMAQAPQLVGTPREDMLISRLAQRVGMSVQRVRDHVSNARRQQARRPVAPVRVDGKQGAPAAKSEPLSKSLATSIECELLEVIFAVPSAFAEVREHVSADDFTHEPFGNVFALCCGLAEQGGLTFDRLMAALEEPTQKALAQRVDEQAREKRVAEKLDQPCGHSEGPARKSYLQQVLEKFTWQRDERLHRAAKGRLAQQLSSAGGRQEDRQAQFEALSRMQAFHAKRAVK
jgi:DNA primase